MRIAFSDPLLCVCDTCVQHRTLSTQETEPASVIDPSVTSVQPLGSTSDQSSGTESPLAPPLPLTTTSVDPEPAPSHADASASTPSPVQTSSPTIIGFPPAVSSELAQPLGSLLSSEASSREANITNIVDSGASAASVPSTFGFGPMQAPNFGSGSSSSTPSPFDAPSSNGPNTSTTPFSFLPAAQDSGKTASTFPTPFANPVGGVRYPHNPFRPNPQTSSLLGSRYPRYAPTPDLDNPGGGQGMLIISISASNSHGHKSHEELRWEDYQKGDKGGFAWSSTANTVSPSSFASPSIPVRPGMRTITWPAQGYRTGLPMGYTNPTGLPIGYTNPTGLQRPHEPAGVSSPASGCTACGATSSSSPSAHVGFNGTTNPPSSAPTTLPYGSMPLMFGAPNLAAYGGTATTTPAIQAYVVIFGTPILAAQGTTITPAVQAYPMMFGTPNLVGPQGTTTTPAVQPFSMMFGTPNLAAQGTSTAPAFQPTMFGTPSFACQGTTTAPAAQPYPMMFGTPSLAAQGTTTTPAPHPYPMMFGTQNLVGQGTATTPPVQPYPMMFGTPNLGAQGITPAAQAYPVNGLTHPFAAMSLQ